MAVRYYSSLDTGAPALSGDFYARTRQVLMACLVNGYGSKAAAGWVVGHDVTNGFSLSNGDGIINFVMVNASNYAAYIMEAITGGTTAQASGVNRRSAFWFEGSSEAARQHFFTDTSTFTGANARWSVVADEKTCIFYFSGGTTSAMTSSSGVHYFGRYINTVGLSGVGEFCSLGGHSVANAFANPLTSQSVQAGMLLRNPFTGLSEQGVGPRYGGSVAQYPRGEYLSDAKLLPLRLQPVRAALCGRGVGVNATANSAASSVCGYLRGVISEPNLAGATLDNVLVLFGLPRTPQAQVQPITLPNAKMWLPIFSNTNNPGLFVSLDESDWG